MPIHMRIVILCLKLEQNRFVNNHYNTDLMKVAIQVQSLASTSVASTSVIPHEYHLTLVVPLFTMGINLNVHK